MSVDYSIVCHGCKSFTHFSRNTQIDVESVNKFITKHRSCMSRPSYLTVMVTDPTAYALDYTNERWEK